MDRNEGDSILECRIRAKRIWIFFWKANNVFIYIKGEILGVSQPIEYKWTRKIEVEDREQKQGKLNSSTAVCILCISGISQKNQEFKTHIAVANPAANNHSPIPPSFSKVFTVHQGTLELEV